MTALIATLIGLPRWVKWMAAGVALVLAFWLWLYKHDRAVVKADREQARAEVTERARDADEASQAKTEAIRAKVRQSSRKAQEAAAQSDDPLKTYFDTLHQEQVSR